MWHHNYRRSPLFIWWISLFNPLQRKNRSGKFQWSKLGNFNNPQQRSKLPGVSLLNQLFDGVGRAAAELRCSVIRSKKIVSFDNFHGFLAILHIWALSLHGGMFANQSILSLERALLFHFPKSDSQAALAASISDHENPRPNHAKRLSRMHFSWPFSCSSHGHIHAFFRVR